MGGRAMKAVSASDYGRLELAFAQSYFVGGEEIQGTVFVTAHEELVVHSLEVQLLGTEETSCYRAKQSVTIIEKRAVLIEPNFEQPQVLAPAKYQFSFKLGTEGARALPSTCRYTSHMLRCQVKYLVVATLHVVGRQVPRLVSSSEVHILEKLKATTHANNVLRCPARIKTTKRDEGYAILTARLSSTALLVPVGFELYIDYDNSDCNASVRRLDIAVNQFVTVNVKGGQRPVVETKVISRWVLAGVGSHSKAFYNYMLLFEDNHISKQAESASGINFSIKYTLSVVPVYCLSSCGEKPSLQCPVDVTNQSQTRHRLEPERAPVFAPLLEMSEHSDLHEPVLNLPGSPHSVAQALPLES